MPADFVSLLPMAVVLVLIGGIAGVVGGLLGVGGGIVLVPAFFYAFQSLGYGGDHLMQICVGTSLATIVVTSIRSVNGHHRKGAVDWQVLRRWGPGLVIGAALGVLVAMQVKSLVLQAVFGALAGLGLSGMGGIGEHGRASHRASAAQTLFEKLASVHW